MNRSEPRIPFLGEPLRKLRTLLEVRGHRWLALWIGAVYLVLYLYALRDISLGGGGFGFRTAEWTRMFERTATVTFEPVAQLTLPGLTVLLSPFNLAIGAVLAGLVGLNLLVTWVAWRYPAACSFNRSAGVLASLPGLFAGGACCAPAIALILGLQMTSALVTTFQALIPLALLLLLVTLKLILDRTNAELAVARTGDAGRV